MYERRKRVLLVAPPSDFLENVRSVPPLGLLSLGTALRLQGHAVSLLILNSLEELCRHAEEQYDFIGITATTRQYLAAIQILNYFKREGSHAVIAIGGSHATAMPQEAIRNGFDIVVTGEADLEISRLVEEGLRSPQVIACDPIRSLNVLPMPDLDLLADQHSWRPFMGIGEDPSMRVAPILLSRGCPFSCAFCGSHAPYRRRSKSHISAELHRLRETGYNGLVVVDDLPFLRESQAFEFCDTVRRFNMRFRCNYRPNLLTPRVAARLKMSGCCRVQLGIESVEAATLQAIGRPDSDVNVRAIQVCRNEGLEVKAMFIWGLPRDSPDTAERLIAWVRQYRPNAIQVSLFTPLPGSTLWDSGLSRCLIDYGKSSLFPVDGKSKLGVGNGHMEAGELMKLYMKIIGDCSQFTYVDHGLNSELAS